MTGTQMAAPRGESNLFAEIGGTEPLTMSSREIAGLCEKKHQHVRRDIEAMCTGLEIDVSSFGRIYIDARNREQTEFSLPKDLTLTLVAGYNVKLRKRIIDRWMELEEERANGGYLIPKTFGEALQLAADQYKQIESMREDVEAHERLTKADGSYNITETAKNLGVRPKDLFGWLSNNGWIYKRPGGAHWLGYQPKCNAGLLEHKSTTVLRADGTEKITEQVRVTAKGLDRLARLIPGVAHEV